MVFDAIGERPLKDVLGDPGLGQWVRTALRASNVDDAAQQLVLPALERVESLCAEADEQLADLMPEDQYEQLRKLLAAGEGPRFPWLRGAIDPADVRELVAPVVAQVLTSFTAKLPIPGAGGADSKAPSLGGLASRFSKQMSRGAGQLAEVAGSVMGGLGAELERRAQGIAKDFSQTAISEFRTAMAERLKSDEGKAIVTRVRAGAVDHVLSAPVNEVVTDLMRLPVEELARWVPPVVAYHADDDPDGTLLREIAEGELAAALEDFSQDTVRQVLSEAGLWDSSRAIVVRFADPPLRTLFESDAFGDWLSRLLES